MMNHRIIWLLTVSAPMSLSLSQASSSGQHACPACTFPDVTQRHGSVKSLRPISALKTAFNGSRGKVRIVALLSPTCPGCRYGAEIVQKDLLNKLKGKKVATFIVWVPMLPGDTVQAAQYSAGIVMDRRATQYWDGQRALGSKYAKIVSLPAGNPIAWDVYFVYGRDALWESQPPKPDYWMHQLSIEKRTLKPDTLLARVRAVLPNASRFK